MRAFSYILRFDDGFAPNPFHGCCTLACCKPVIRRVARSGDIVVGLTARSEHVAYAMVVDQVLSFGEYWNDSEFASKRPTLQSSIRRCGDNAYRPKRDGGYAAVASMHHQSGENLAMTRKDLSGRCVLTSRRFTYFGRESVPLPRELAFLTVGRGHRSRFSPNQVEAVANWVSGLPQGRLGLPRLWPPPIWSSARSCAASVEPPCGHKSTC